MAVDLLAHVVDLELLVVRPFRGHAVELVFGVLQRDVRIEARAGSRHEIAGDVLESGVRMILPPHVEEDRLDVGARP